MDQPAGTPLAAPDAWRKFDDWRAHSLEIGILFFGTSGTVTTTGTVTQARMGHLQFNSASSELSFRLQNANFLYGPVQTFPNWPYPPAVEIVAVQACFPNGDWLVMAERFRPPSVR